MTGTFIGGIYFFEYCARCMHYCKPQAIMWISLTSKQGPVKRKRLLRGKTSAMLIYSEGRNLKPPTVYLISTNYTLKTGVTGGLTKDVLISRK